VLIGGCSLSVVWARSRSSLSVLVRREAQQQNAHYELVKLWLPTVMGGALRRRPQEVQYRRRRSTHSFNDPSREAGKEA